jgi:lactoylglutathione lyase
MARLVGLNHVALEVGDVDEALDWYGHFFSFQLRSRAGSRAAFTDMGDQFIALMVGRTQSPDMARHIGLVVDDKEAVRGALGQEGIDVGTSGSLDFIDPWGNHVQVVDYREIQFTKAPPVLDGMGLGALEKTDRALGVHVASVVQVPLAQRAEADLSDAGSALFTHVAHRRSSQIPALPRNRSTQFTGMSSTLAMRNFASMAPG